MFNKKVYNLVNNISNKIFRGGAKKGIKTYQKHQNGLMVDNIDIVDVFKKSVITYFNTVAFPIATYICKM